MKSIEDIRAELRAEGNFKAETSGIGSAIVTTLGAILAACLGAWGAYVLFFKPVVVPLRPSAALPTFQQVQAELEGHSTQSPFVPAPGEMARASSKSEVSYAGKSPTEMGKLADEVCFARAHARYPHWSKTPRLTTKEVQDFFKDEMPHFNELMRCLLTEAPTRYCSASQRKMLTAEIVMYFRGIQHNHKSLAALRSQLSARGADGEHVQKLYDAEIAADQGVMAAIEARLRDGLLTKADHDRFSAALPPNLQHRFANIKPAKSPCPEHPWWAFWR